MKKVVISSYTRQDREKVKGDIVLSKELLKTLSSFGFKDLFKFNIHSSKEQRVYVFMMSFYNVKLLILKAGATEVWTDGGLQIKSECVKKERKGISIEKFSCNFTELSGKIWMTKCFKMLEAAKHYYEDGKEVIGIALHALLFRDAESELKKYVKMIYTTTSIIRENNPIEKIRVWKVLV